MTREKRQVGGRGGGSLEKAILLRTISVPALFLLASLMCTIDLCSQKLKTEAGTVYPNAP